MNTITPFEEPRITTAAFNAHDNFLDVITRNKIQRHLTDINDVITEEDIRNIDTSITLKAFKTQFENRY